MKDPLNEARRWFDQAWNDWEFVQWLSVENRFHDKGCFIAQQASEKALKACLYALGERSLMMHSTFELATKLTSRHPKLKDILDEAKRLDRFYIPTRYPNGLPGGVPYQQFDSGDFMSAAGDCERVINLCREFLISQGVKI